MATITNILGSDRVTDSRSVINTNFTNVNNAVIQKTVATIGMSAGADYVCDGIQDDVQFNAALTDISSNGGGDIFVKYGSYIGNNIIPKNNVRILFESGANITNDGSGSLSIFRHVDDTNGLHNFELINGTFHGASGGTCWYSRGNINNCRFLYNEFDSGSVGSFIVFFDAFASNPYNIIRHNYFHGTTGGWDMLGSGALDYVDLAFNRWANGNAQGWGITSCNYARCIGNTFYKVGNAIGHEGTTTNCLVANNIVMQSGQIKLSLNNGTDVSYGNVVEDNVMLYSTGIFDGAGFFDKIQNNLIYRSPGNGIVGAWNRSTIQNNSLIDTNYTNSAITIGGIPQTNGGIVLLNQTAVIANPTNNVVQGNNLYCTRTAFTDPDGNSRTAFTGGILIDSSFIGTDVSDNHSDNTYKPLGDYGTGTRGTNNYGIDPLGLYAQGNITGAITFNRINGDVITATLTGNITVTLTAGSIAGDALTLELTQDGTGSRTVTWPSNFKKAGGTLTLSTGAAAVDVIKMRWDGTNWREVSRALNQS